MDVIVRNCKFCKKPCTEPKFLPCTHAFCKLCLKFQIIKVPTNRQWEGFSCPSCNTYTKAIDPDQPLATWADQFPDSLTRRKPMSKGSSEDHSDSPSAASPRTPSSVRFPSTSGSDSPGPFSPQSPGPYSPGSTSSVPESPGIDNLDNSQNLANLSSRNASKSETAMTPEPVAQSPPDVFSLENVEPPGLETTSKSSFDDPDSVGIDEGLADLSVSSPGVFDEALPVFTSNEDEKMCVIHPWKPIIVSCKNCNNNIACGQCLVETHPTCKGEDFVPITEKPVLPDITELESEVEKVDQANERMKSSTDQLQKTRELIRQKIKQIALLLIQKMKRDEEQMVKKVEQVYHNEIWRLKSGINPSENLLKQVQALKDRTEDLYKQHPAAVVQQADSVQEEQEVLLERVKAVDYACVPPELTFIPNYDILALALGDLVIDEGYYPKHDIPEPQHMDIQKTKETPPRPQSVPVVSPNAKISRTSQSEQASPSTPPTPLTPPTSLTLPTPPTPDVIPVQASGSKAKTSEQTGKQKSKSKSIFDKIRSPKQKQSKFFVKFPEL